MSEAHKALAARFFDEVCNGRRLDVADELFSPTHVHHDPAHPETANGPEGMKQLIGIYHTSVKDAHWHVGSMSVTDDGSVVTRWTGTGVHGAELGGIAPTGNPVKVAGIWIHRIADGRIVESWSVWDALGLLRQIGGIPARAQSAAE
jgi:steroid delta-isomerase-like uncharacterized protein